MKDKFFDLFWTRAIRWEEAECADLPAKEYVQLPLEMTSKQRQVYESILAVDPSNPTSIVGEDDPTWELLRVTGGIHAKLKGEKVPSVKLEALGHIIDEVVIAKNDVLIIWHWRVEEGELIAKYIRENYPAIKIGEARGNVSKAKKDKVLEDWAAGTVRILVANPGSIGQGIDLYEANIAVYYSNSRSQIHRSQSEKRIHRDGQTRNCWYYDLTCEDTIDELVLDQLKASQNAFAGLTRDRAWKKLRKQRKK
jgi:SNF2 family DNA or RNA helicase